MVPRRQWWRKLMPGLWALTSSGGLLLAAPPPAGPPAEPGGSSPLKRIVPTERRYPEGRRLEAVYLLGSEARPQPEAAVPAALGMMAMAKGGRLTDRGTPRGPQLQATAQLPVTFGKRIFINFKLSHKNIPLDALSSRMLILSEDGVPIATREVQIPRSIDGTIPTVDAKVAVQRGRDEAMSYLKYLYPLDNIVLQVSTPTLEITVDEARSGRLAWTFVVSSNTVTVPYSKRFSFAAIGPPGAPGTTRPLAGSNQLFHDHEGTVFGTAWMAEPGGPTGEVPLVGAEVVRETPGKLTQNTDTEGHFRFSPGAGEGLFNARLSGQACTIEDMSNNPVVGVVRGGANGPIRILLDPDDTDPKSKEYKTAQITAFYWLARARAFCSPLLESNDDKLRAVRARINIRSAGNAFWDDSNHTVNFYSSGVRVTKATVPNAPSIQETFANFACRDVIIHEFGHGVDSQLWGILDGGYSEGFGDALVILMTGQSKIGRNYDTKGGVLRDADERGDRQKWPPKPDPFDPGAPPEIHEVGQIYAGFVWDLLKLLRDKHKGDDKQALEAAGRLVLTAAAANPKDIPDAVKLSFIADLDDDNDWRNGTECSVELARAAAGRNIPIPKEYTGPRGPEMRRPEPRGSSSR